MSDRHAPTWSPDRVAARSYVLAILSIALTTLLRFALNPFLGRRAAFIVYFPALVLSAWLGGWLGGLMALALSTLLASYFFISPNHSLLIGGNTDRLTLFVFVIVGLAVSALSASQRSAHSQAEEAREQAQQAADDADERGRALEESEARYRHLLETANEGVLTVNAEDDISYVNPRLAEMLGCATDTLQGHPVYALLFPEDADEARRRRGERKRGVQEQYELRLRRGDGAAIWALANVSVLWEGEKYIGTFSLLTDITERRRAEEELRSAYARETLVNGIGLAVRGTSSPQMVLQTTVAALGPAVGADRCYYVSYDTERDYGTLGPEWHIEGLASVAGEYRLSEYVPNRNAAYMAGQTDVVEDAFALPDNPLAVKLGLRSLVRVPLRRDGVMTALVVAMAHVSRKWTADEIALVETVAAQTRGAVDGARAIQRERGFLRDVLASVTEGKLLLMSASAQLPPSLTLMGDAIPLTREGGLRELRQRAQEAARVAGLADERQFDLVTAASEAGMNAVVHADGGLAWVGVGEMGTVQVRVSDQGGGIPVENLPRAALARGFSTKATLGHGLKMMLETIDRLYLLTGSDGTTVVIEQEREPPLPSWLSDALAASPVPK